ncbi:MAG: glycosyltransferase, partial [bacterium]|nr:glycosyltransferase [bacterium]
QSLKIKPGAKVVGIVARLVKEKGFLPLFEAFAEVKKQVPEAILLVVGPEEPEKEDALDPKEVSRYGIEESVIFLGERTDVEELYPVMDVFVLPSFREGLGLSILEASAMKVPVVASDIRGCREGVEDGVTGFLVPSNNPERLAEALVRVLKNPQEAKKMGEAGRRRVERDFDEKKVFLRIKKEYESLLKKNL